MYERLSKLSFMANILPYYGDHETQKQLTQNLNPELIIQYPILFTPPIFKNIWIDNLFKQINEDFYMALKLHTPKLYIDIKTDKIAGQKLYYKKNIVGDISDKRIIIH